MKLTIKQKIYYRSVDKVKHYLLKKSVQRSKYVYGLNTNEKREKKIIVSLTTFPARFQIIELCIKSILLQTIKPDKIIIWLGSDSKDKSLEELRKFEEFGVEIRIDEEKDLKSHKKYFYCMSEFPDDLIITLDDDLIYPNDLIASLLSTHKKYPNCIVARRVHRITWIGECVNKYNEWIGECSTITNPSFELVPTTGAGTLYPPKCLYSDYNNEELLRSLSFLADDIWLKFMSLLNGTKVVWAKNTMQMPATIINDSTSLKTVNCFENNNDVCVANLMSFYKVRRVQFQDWE